MSEQREVREKLGFAPFDELVAALKDRGFVDVTVLRHWHYRVGLVETSQLPIISVGSLQKRDGEDIVVPMYEYLKNNNGDGLDIVIASGSPENLCPIEYRDPNELFRGISYVGRFIVNGVV
jgi:hypothetical protein